MKSITGVAAANCQLVQSREITDFARSMTN